MQKRVIHKIYLNRFALILLGWFLGMLSYAQSVSALTSQTCIVALSKPYADEFEAQYLLTAGKLLPSADEFFKSHQPGWYLFSAAKEEWFQHPLFPDWKKIKQHSSTVYWADPQSLLRQVKQWYEKGQEVYSFDYFWYRDDSGKPVGILFGNRPISQEHFLNAVKSLRERGIDVSYMGVKPHLDSKIYQSEVSAFTQVFSRFENIMNAQNEMNTFIDIVGKVSTLSEREFQKLNKKLLDLAQLEKLEIRKRVSGDSTIHAKLEMLLPNVRLQRLLQSCRKIDSASHSLVDLFNNHYLSTHYLYVTLQGHPIAPSLRELAGNYEPHVLLPHFYLAHGASADLHGVSLVRPFSDKASESAGVAKLVNARVLEQVQIDLNWLLQSVRALDVVKRPEHGVLPKPKKFIL